MRIRTKVTYLGKPIVKAVGDKRLLSRVLSDKFKPTRAFMVVLGEVLREGFRGGWHPTSLRVGMGGLAVTPVGKKQFPRGIMRGISPDGHRYRKLKDITLRKKAQLGSPHVGDPLQRRPDVDRMTLKNSMAVNVRSTRADLRFRDAKMNERSLVHEHGRKNYWSEDDGWTTNSEKNDGKVLVNIPARPHRGIQPEVARVVNRLTREYLKKIGR